jgi:type IV pilus assembly protein PilB
MPNKTIYIREEDMSVFENAQKMGKDSISAIVTSALRDYVAKEEEKNKGEQESAQLLDSILAKAASVHASDIHIQPMRKGSSVRFRVDGVLRESDPLTPQQHNAVMASCKHLAGQDGGENMLLQGKIQSLEIAGRKIDMRVCIVPSILGECVTMRILETEATLPDVAQLEVQGEHAAQLTQLAAKPFGAILVSGPTGCGKTSTIYSMLKQIDRSHQKVMTVEDPVEYIIERCVQIPLTTLPGSTFPGVLRTILGSDPDVIFVGEIRDKETALICMEAACTGHLVFSLLHAHAAPAALLRLIHIGIEPFLVRDAVIGIVGQRLVRCLCKECKTRDNASYRQLELERYIESGIQLFKAVGCKKCGQSGYKGRTALFEVLLPSSEVQQAIMRGVAEDELNKIAHKEGMKTLLEDGLDKAARGYTSVSEVLRVMQGNISA